MPAEPIRIWEKDPPGLDLFPNDAKNLGLPTLTPYLIVDGKPHPVVIVVPGGGFEERMPFSQGGHGRGLGTEEPALAVWTKLCADWLGRL